MDAALNQFYQHLGVERGLASLTVEAYARDLQDFWGFIEGRGRSHWGIVALADFYDALVSKRVYKDSFSEAEALDLIREQSGKQFDPEVVAAFLAIYEVIAAIKNKYREDSSPPLSCQEVP